MARCDVRDVQRYIMVRKMKDRGEIRTVPG